MAGKNLIQVFSKTTLANAFTKELIGFQLVSEYVKKDNTNERLVELATVAFMLDVPQKRFFIDRIQLNTKLN